MNDPRTMPSGHRKVRVPDTLLQRSEQGQSNPNVFLVANIEKFQKISIQKFTCHEAVDSLHVRFVFAESLRQTLPYPIGDEFYSSSSRRAVVVTKFYSVCCRSELKEKLTIGQLDALAPYGQHTIKGMVISHWLHPNVPFSRRTRGGTADTVLNGSQNEAQQHQVRFQLSNFTVNERKNVRAALQGSKRKIRRHVS